VQVAVDYLTQAEFDYLANCSYLSDKAAGDYLANSISDYLSSCS
jgi:hypothetical protein